MRQHLIVFTRYPEPGKTKRRLIPTLGPEGAADLQREMTGHTLCWVRELMCRRGLSVEVRFAGGNKGLMQARFGTGWAYRPQGDGDLGQRMGRAFRDAFQTGMKKVVIVGTDCPGMTAALVWSGYAALRDHDVVLGPAIDGGYYLIGLRGEVPQLVEGISWGTGDVLKRTLDVIGRLGLSVAQLTPLRDVDRPEDLDVWNAARGSTQEEVISIVIPTFNEGAVLDETLQCLRGAAKLETIVVDAGSEDGTLAVARAHGARIISTGKGRARQMNAGAAVAMGPLLLFLHADTQLPVGFDQHVRRALDRPRTTLRAVPVAGAFRLRIDSLQPALRLIEWGVNFRSRYLQMPYGDQGLFLKAETFRAIGGFPDLPMMEDFELVRRLRRLGRISIVSSSATTSARRWLELGPWRTTWINQKVIAGHYLGVPPDRLAQWYRETDRGARPTGRDRPVSDPGNP